MGNPVKALLIGCGNIGAQYDLNSKAILTHAKAWNLTPDVDLTVFDLDRALQEEIALLYNCSVLESIDEESLSQFDCISICTPTNTHYELLESAFKAGVKTIICEKPVSLSVLELDNLARKYNEAESSVLVNYIRRFQPAFWQLKEFIFSIRFEDTLTNLNIRYQRGFLNNCSHAFDLIQFLFDKELVLDDMQISNRIFDHFDNDPTISFNAKWDQANFSVLGLGNVLFAHFEIDFYFKHHKISIKNAGDLIEVYRAEYNGKTLQPLLKINEFTLCLKDYMKFVIQETLSLINGSKEVDNFEEAVILNKKMLNYLKN